MVDVLEPVVFHQLLQILAARPVKSLDEGQEIQVRLYLLIVFGRPPHRGLPALFGIHAGDPCKMVEWGEAVGRGVGREGRKTSEVGDRETQAHEIREGGRRCQWEG